LGKCIHSILSQTLLASELVIIDDGNLPSGLLSQIKKRLEDKEIGFVYYKKNHQKERRGLSESKNVAIKIIRNEVFFILDDDLILDNDFFEKIMNVWKNNGNPNLIGVGGIIKNNRKKGFLEKTYNKIFGLTSKYEWDINDVGFQVWDEGIKERKKGYYAHGGVCSYNKPLVEKLGGFTTFSGGRTANEDVDFCLRAKNKGYFFIMEPDAKVIHKQSKTSKEGEFLMGFKESYNRKIIFKNNCKKIFKTRLWFYWANVGWILRQFSVGHFERGAGMIKGFLMPII